MNNATLLVPNKWSLFDLGDVLVERRHRWPVGGVGHQVGGVDVHPLEQHPRGGEHLSVGRPARVGCPEYQSVL